MGESQIFFLMDDGAVNKEHKLQYSMKLMHVGRLCHVIRRAIFRLVAQTGKRAETTSWGQSRVADYKF